MDVNVQTKGVSVAKLGIENAKKVIALMSFLANLGDDVGRDTSPSRWTKLLGLVGVFNQIGSLDFKVIGPELADLDLTERQELLAVLRKDLDLADDKLESSIEESISIVTDLASIIERSSNLVKALKA